MPSRLVRGYAANEKVNVGIIGVGGQGGVNRKWLENDGANIVALCDVDRRALQRGARDHPDARLWSDYREMLDRQQDIDGVMISTPDHHHFHASLLAMQHGKAVCTEKPLAHSVWEVRQLTEAAKKYKVATQLDNENHSADGLRLCVEWIKSGAIGTVREVHIWTDRPIWPQAMTKRPPAKPAPRYLDWDLWIGPAPYREYHDGLHDFKWRGWWDFGGGALGDMGCHFFDSAFWALDLGQPKTVDAVEEGNTAECGPVWSVITYEFPQRGDRPEVVLKWYDGGRMPPRPKELEEDRRMPVNGSLFIGDAGTILVSDAASPRLIPESKMQAFERPKPFIPRSIGHKKEWLRAIQGGEAAGSNFADYGGPLTEAVLLGNVAIRTGRRIEWDAVNLKAKNVPEAEQYIRREYRSGWEIERI